MSVTCLRWFIVCALFSLTLRRQLAAQWPLVQPHWRRLAILGGTAFTLFNALFYVSAQYTSAVNMAVLQGTFPALVILGMAIIFGAAITGVQVMGIVVTFCGVAIIASKGELRDLDGVHLQPRRCPDAHRHNDLRGLHDRASRSPESLGARGFRGARGGGFPYLGSVSRHGNPLGRELLAKLQGDLRPDLSPPSGRRFSRRSFTSEASS